MRGWDLHLRQVVAVRLFAQQDEADKFVEQARALTDLSHPGLVRVLDAGIADDGEPFLVQEFIAGTTLRARLTQGALSASEVTELGSALGRALAYAHQQGVAHRDIHPGNILLGPSMEPYLTDVGIAESTAVSYMAPEQANGEQPTMASDVYSFGLVLLETLTGRTEYPGDDATTALARLSRAPIIKPDLPHAKALQAMLSSNPNDRPDAATCVDLLRGSSAKARVQTRTVLIAAVAAAIAATSIAVVVNLPKQQQQPLMEPNVVPQRQTVTATPTNPGTPTVNEVADQTPEETTKSPTTEVTSQEQEQEQQQPLIQDQPVGLGQNPPTYTTPWQPWYPWEEIVKHKKKPKTPKPPPSPVGDEEEGEED